MQTSTSTSRAIVHVIEDLKPESGGPTTVVVELARAQALSGHRVGVICLHGPTHGEGRQRLAENFEAAGVRLFDLDSSSARPGRREVVAALRAGRADLVHLHGVWSSVLRWSAEEAVLAGSKYVISTHGMLHPDVLRQGRLKKWVYLTLFSRLLGRCSEVLALNEEERQYVAQRFARPASVLPNGIRAELYDGLSPDEFRRSWPSINAPFALFLGRLHPIKGIDLLIRAFAQARAQGLQSHLVVAGPDSGSLTDLMRLAAELGVSPEVHFVGPLYEGAKLSALAACTMFVHRPRFEGFGLTVVEAMASGRPVVTTPRCRLDGAASAGALVMAEDRDDPFAAAMLALERDPQLAEGLGERGRAWVRANFDWKSIARQTDRVYENACSGRSNPR
jgi:glycosyltransferase involved in cell wall biosynthesis